MVKVEVYITEKMKATALQRINILSVFNLRRTISFQVNVNRNVLWKVKKKETCLRLVLRKK